MLIFDVHRNIRIYFLKPLRSKAKPTFVNPFFILGRAKILSATKIMTNTTFKIMDSQIELRNNRSRSMGI